MHVFKRIGALLIIMSLAAGVWLGYRQVQPPALSAGFEEQTITLDQAAQGPDLNLMLSHVKEMASQVHSVDTDGIRHTQGYLVDQLTQMGYAVQEERYELSMEEILALERERVDYRGKEFRSTEDSIRSYSGIGDKPHMVLTNLYVMLDAPDTDETVLFMAHTDSVTMGPGAFDDTVSVAAMMEALRLLRGQAPVRDLIFLFTDGEEQGLLGAAKFVQDHPELKEKTKLVVNLEARGNRGALLMFETTPNNLNMVRAYAGAVGTPVSISLATGVYQTMQNDTDLTRFMMEGYPGLNFAVIEGAEVYHTPDDDFEGFDRASAGHYLQTVTGLAQGFAIEKDLTFAASEDGVFFPLLTGNLVILPQGTANLIAYAAFGAFLVMLIWLLSRGKARLGTVLGSFGVQLLSLAAAGGLSMLVTKWVLSAQGIEAYRDVLGYQGAQPVFLLMVAFFVLLTAALYGLLWRKAPAGPSIAMGALLLPALLALATAFLFPSASYLFSLPVLAGLVVVLLNRWCRMRLLHAAFALLTLLLFVPIVHLVFVALSFNMAYAAVAVAIISAAVVAGILSLPWAETQQ